LSDDDDTFGSGTAFFAALLCGFATAEEALLVLLPFGEVAGIAETVALRVAPALGEAADCVAFSAGNPLDPIATVTLLVRDC